MSVATLDGEVVHPFRRIENDTYETGYLGGDGVYNKGYYEKEIDEIQKWHDEHKKSARNIILTQIGTIVGLAILGIGIGCSLTSVTVFSTVAIKVVGVTSAFFSGIAVLSFSLYNTRDIYKSQKKSQKEVNAKVERLYNGDRRHKGCTNHFIIVKEQFVEDEFTAVDKSLMSPYIQWQHVSQRFKDRVKFDERITLFGGDVTFFKVNPFRITREIDKITLEANKEVAKTKYASWRVLLKDLARESSGFKGDLGCKVTLPELDCVGAMVGPPDRHNFPTNQFFNQAKQLGYKVDLEARQIKIVKVYNGNEKRTWDVSSAEEMRQFLKEQFSSGASGPQKREVLSIK